MSTLFLAHVDLKKTEILLCAENLKSLVSEAWSHYDLKEDWLHKLCNLLVHLTVHCNDTAEDAHLVCLVCLCPCVNHVSSDGSTARVHMLETYAERSVELANDVESCVCILDVVV